MLVAGGSPRFVVHGSEGSLITQGLDPQEGQLAAGLRPGAANWGCTDIAIARFDDEGRESASAMMAGDYPRFYAGIAAALEGAPLPVTPAQSLAVMAVMEAAAIAANTGTAQVVPPFR